MASPLAIEHALVWGSDLGPGASKADRAWHLCRQYIERGVAGVFFAPLELTPDKDDTNKRIAEALDAAGIPIILLDRTVLPYPQRGHHDLVGIDNRRAGFLVTEHLLRQGVAPDRVRRRPPRGGHRRRARSRLPRSALRVERADRSQPHPSPRSGRNHPTSARSSTAIAPPTRSSARTTGRPPASCARSSGSA